MSKLTVFSQTDTLELTKCFTIPMVKVIIKDLLRGDSAISLLKLTEIQLAENEKKSILKDSIISTMVIREKNYLSIIENERNKFKIQKDYSSDLEKKLKKERVRNKFTKTILGSLISVLIVFHILN